MSSERRQAIRSVLLVLRCVTILVALAWWSLAGMALVTLGTLVGSAVGWRLDYRHATDQAEQARRARLRRAAVRVPSRSRSAK